MRQGLARYSVGTLSSDGLPDGEPKDTVVPVLLSLV